MTAALIKMINGDELVAIVIHEDDNSYIFRDPMALAQRITPQGETIDVLANYIDMSDNIDIEIKKEHVICVTTLSREYERYYEISKTYNAKYIKPGLIEKVVKVTDAMQEILFAPPSKLTVDIKQQSANNTLH